MTPKAEVPREDNLYVVGRSLCYFGFWEDVKTWFVPIRHYRGYLHPPHLTRSPISEVPRACPVSPQTNVDTERIIFILKYTTYSLKFEFSQEGEWLWFLLRSRDTYFKKGNSSGCNSAERCGWLLFPCVPDQHVGITRTHILACVLRASRAKPTLPCEGEPSSVMLWRRNIYAR